MRLSLAILLFTLIFETANAYNICDTLLPFNFVFFECVRFLERGIQLPARSQNLIAFGRANGYRHIISF